MQSASAWAARLLAAFPLYRDLLQPVALAVFEMCAGLRALASAQRNMQAGSRDAQLGAVVAQLGTFPAHPWDKGAQQTFLWPFCTLVPVMYLHPDSHDHRAFAYLEGGADSACFAVREIGATLDAGGSQLATTPALQLVTATAAAAVDEHSAAASEAAAYTARLQLLHVALHQSAKAVVSSSAVRSGVQVETGDQCDDA